MRTAFVTIPTASVCTAAPAEDEQRSRKIDGLVRIVDAQAGIVLHCRQFYTIDDTVSDGLSRTVRPTLDQNLGPKRAQTVVDDEGKRLAQEIADIGPEPGRRVSTADWQRMDRGALSRAYDNTCAVIDRAERLAIVCGGDEAFELRRQSAEYDRAWKAWGNASPDAEPIGEAHSSILDGLIDPGGAPTARAVAPTRPGEIQVLIPNATAATSVLRRKARRPLHRQEAMPPAMPRPAPPPWRSCWCVTCSAGTARAIVSADHIGCARSPLRGGRIVRTVDV